MGEQLNLDPQQEQQLASANASKLLGKSSETQAAYKQFADALKKGSASEQDILLSIKSAIDGILNTSEIQFKEQRADLKKLAEETRDGFLKAYSDSGAVTGEDIEKLATNLGKVISGAGTGSKGAGDEYTKKLIHLEKQASSLAQVVTDFANKAVDAGDQFHQAVEDIAGEMDKGRSAPAVGEVLGARDPNWQPDAPQPTEELDLTKVIKSDLIDPLTEALKNIGKSFTAVDKISEPITEKLDEIQAENVRRQNEKEKKEEEEKKRQEKVKFDTMLENALLSVFGDPIRLLGVGVGMIIGLRDEIGAAFDIVIEWTKGLWPRVKEWLAERFGSLEAIQKTLGSVFQAVFNPLDTMSASIKEVVDLFSSWWSKQKTEEELKRERAAMVMAGKHTVAQSLLKEGGVVGKTVQNALEQGIDPGMASSFGTMARINPELANKAVETYKSAIDSGEHPSRAQAAAEAVFKAGGVEEGVKATVTGDALDAYNSAIEAGKASSTSISTDHEAQSNMMNKNSESAAATKEMAMAARQQAAAIEKLAASQKSPTRGAEHLDTVTTGPDTIAMAYMSGATGGTSVI